MKVSLAPLTGERDRLLLVRADAFMRVVDQANLGCRESRVIRDVYHCDWFTPGRAGIERFQAPAFCLSNGVATVIDGRHRTILLCRHLREVPMALTDLDLSAYAGGTPTAASLHTLEALTVAELTGHESFEFPDLPKKYLGFCLNRGR